jgi:hypothetical protein
MSDPRLFTLTIDGVDHTLSLVQAGKLVTVGRCLYDESDPSRVRLAYGFTAEDPIVAGVLAESIPLSLEDVRAVIRDGLANGDIEVVGDRDGSPVYDLTEKGRDRLALDQEWFPT